MNNTEHMKRTNELLPAAGSVAVYERVMLATRFDAWQCEKD